MNIKRLGITEVVVPPHLGDQIIPGNQLPATQQEKFEQGELLGAKLNFLAAHRGHVPTDVDRDISANQDNIVSINLNAERRRLAPTLATSSRIENGFVT